MRTNCKDRQHNASCVGRVWTQNRGKDQFASVLASWSDCLHMVHQRHEVLVNHLEVGGETPYLSVAVEAARELMGASSGNATFSKY